MKKSVSTNLGFILASCLLIVLGIGLAILLERSSNREYKNAEDKVREVEELLMKSVSFSMAEGVTSAKPFVDMLNQIENFSDVRVIPTALIDEERSRDMDDFENNVVNSKKAHFYYEEYMGQEVIRVVNPIIATENCLDCHEASLGDPLAVISIRYSLEETKASVNDQRLLASFIVVTCIVITFIVMMFLINKRVISDLKRIIESLKKFSVGDVSDVITTNRKDELGDALKSLRVLQMNLSGKTEVAAQIAGGNLGVKVEILSNEDELGLAMQTMRDNIHSSITQIEKQNWLKTGVSGLNEMMRGEQDLKSLAQNVISYMAKYSDAKVGAIYLQNGSDTLDLVGSYAFTHRKGNKNSFKLGEGLVGQAALEKQTIIFDDVPENYIKINSGLGHSEPKNIIVTPLLYEDKVSGAVEVGSAKPFTEDQMEFFRLVSENIAIAVNSARSRDKLKELLEKTQEQAEELQAQQEELRVTNEELQSQQEELRVTNEELEEQAKALKESEEDLKQKQSALIKANEALESQKQEIVDKNDDLEKARKQVEEKAKQLEITNKYKSEFLANMSHELRTPMNSIQILSKLLADNKENNLNKKQIEFANTIHSSGSDLLELINEILDLSKIEAGKMTMNFAEMPVTQLPKYIQQSFKHVTDQKGLYLKVENDPKLPEKIITDRQRLEQILKNLLSNAIKFTSEGGITVSVAVPKKEEMPEMSELDPANTVRISVIDTGIGIPEDKQKLIFEAFQQADGTTSRKYGGTGLGLSISRELVRMLQGEFHLESTPGKGSNFSLLLPFTVTEVEIQEREVVEETKDLGSDEKKWVRQDTVKLAERKLNEIKDDRLEISNEDRSILVVDDDPRFARILFDLIHEKGYKCILAEDGEAGLQMATQYKPSAIILDVGLPRIDGWTVMERLKSNRETRHIPVYFISAHDRKLDAMKMGAIGFLTKPVEPDLLNGVFDKIESIISRKIKKVLVVEDDKDMRRSIEELLVNTDVKITSVEKGKTALDKVKKEEFDCMVLDLGLKDISGFDLIEKIKSGEGMEELPIIIYTGRDLDKAEEQKLRKHAESIIIKGAKSPERLQDEVSLFLHKVVSGISDGKKSGAKKAGGNEDLLAGKRILIVDDDVRNIFALSSVLGEREMNVDVAENGREALEFLDKTEQIDLVLMDIMMPEMDGYEAMTQIRKKQHYKNLPIIALTAKAMKGDRQKCIEAGASDYLSKPIDVEKLLSLMQVWLYK